MLERHTDVVHILRRVAKNANPDKICKNQVRRIYKKGAGESVRSVWMQVAILKDWRLPLGVLPVTR